MTLGNGLASYQSQSQFLALYPSFVLGAKNKKLFDKYINIYRTVSDYVVVPLKERGY